MPKRCTRCKVVLPDESNRTLCSLCSDIACIAEVKPQMEYLLKIIPEDGNWDTTCYLDHAMRRLCKLRDTLRQHLGGKNY